MYDHHLKDMVNALEKEGLIQNNEKALKILKDYWDDKIAITWSVEDVILRAKNLGKELNEEQAKDVLQSVLHHHDCTIGLNWDVLDCYIEEVESCK